MQPFGRRMTRSDAIRGTLERGLAVVGAERFLTVEERMSPHARGSAVAVEDWRIAQGMPQARDRAEWLEQRRAAEASWAESRRRGHEIIAANKRNIGRLARLGLEWNDPDILAGGAAGREKLRRAGFRYADEPSPPEPRPPQSSLVAQRAQVRRAQRGPTRTHKTAAPRRRGSGGTAKSRSSPSESGDAPPAEPPSRRKKLPPSTSKLLRYETPSGPPRSPRDPSSTCPLTPTTRSGATTSGPRSKGRQTKASWTSTLAGSCTTTLSSR